MEARDLATLFSLMDAYFEAVDTFCDWTPESVMSVDEVVALEDDARQAVSREMERLVPIDEETGLWPWEDRLGHIAEVA